MIEPVSKNDEISPLSNFDIIKHYDLLHDLGIISYIETTNKQLNNYQRLFSGALNLFNGTTVDEIMTIAVEQTFMRFLPDSIYFLWKPLKDKETMRIFGYKNCTLIKQKDIDFNIRSLAPFEDFFLKNPRPVTCEDLEKFDKTWFMRDLFDKICLKIIIPVIVPSGLYGLALLGPKLLTGTYAASEIDFIQYFAAFISQAIQTRLHYEHSLRDIKTGLFNHVFFMARLFEELERIQRTNTPSSVIMLDIDFFKRFNDNYGHLAGDAILENLSRIIITKMRGQDVSSRFGGEEFTILLPNTTRDMAWIAAERLRKSVAEMQVKWEKPLPQVTISLGLFTLNGSEEARHITPNEVITRADRAMYQSKKEGRNRTTCYSGGFLFRLQQYREMLREK
jgi:diguanylate cyclase (GGDEF)-like protein